MSDQLTLAAGTQNRALSQWFTPAALARQIVEWALAPRSTYQTVIEPSAGIGNLALAIRTASRPVAIGSPMCIDIDPENCVRLRAHGFVALCADFLELQPEGFDDEDACELQRFDLAIMNPPFECGQTERHIMHALKFADRVVCHCPLTTLAGKARRESMWSNVQLHRLAICSSRPKYGAEGGKTDMCTIDVTLLDHRGRRDATDVEWWP